MTENKSINQEELIFKERLIKELDYIKYNLYLNFKAQIFSYLLLKQPEASEHDIVEYTESFVKLLDTQHPSNVKSKEE